MNHPSTLGELRASGYRVLPVKDELREEPDRKDRKGRAPLSGDHRIRRDGRSGPGQRDPGETRHHSPGASRAGEDPHRPAAGLSARRVHPDRPGERDQRRSPAAGEPVRGGPCTREGGRNPHRVDPPGPAVRREARHAGRDDRRSHRGHRSDQGRDPASALRSRRGDPFRDHPADQPRHLRHQRAARPPAAHPGRPLQHPRGEGHPDPGLQHPDPAGSGPGLHREPGGLHQPGKHHHAAQGPHRFADPDPLSRRPWRKRSVSPPRRRTSSGRGGRWRSPSSSARSSR